MKSNIQNQRGYALFIVMGLMVLSTIGVMATYKAVSSYDDKSGAGFKNRGAKEITAAGIRAVESYITNNTYDAFGLLQQMYVDKKDSAEVKPIKVPIENIKGNHSWYEIYLTDISWDNANLFVKAQIMGMNNSVDTSKSSQEILFKIKGIEVDSIVQNIAADVTSACLPDVALYLGGNQSTEIKKNLYISGGFYSSQINKTWETQFTIEGGMALGGLVNLGSEIRDQGTAYNTPGDYFLGQPILYTYGGANMKTDPLKFDGNVEFANSFNTAGNDNTFYMDSIYVSKDLSILNWTPTLYKPSLVIKVGGNLQYFGGFSLARKWSGTPRLKYDVQKNLTFNNGFSKNTSGFPRVTFRVREGHVVIKGNVNIDVSGWQRDYIYVMNSDSIAILGNYSSLINNSIRCKGNTDCHIITNEADIPDDWNYEFKRASTELGLNTTTFKKPMDIKIDTDSINHYKKTWKQLYELAQMDGLSMVSGTKNKISIIDANTMTSSTKFVGDYGYAGFLVLNGDGEAETQTSDAYNAYGQEQLLYGKWVVMNTSKFVTYDPSVPTCFPETHSSARVLWYNTYPQFALGFCDGDGDGKRNFYGFVYEGATAATNTLFRDDSHIYGAVYTKSGNSVAFSGGAVSGDSTTVTTDSIFFSGEVLSDIAPVGLVKIDANGAPEINCLTGVGDDTLNTFQKAGVLQHLLRLKASQVSVSLVGMTNLTDIDTKVEEMSTKNAKSMTVPYVGISHDSIKINAGVYDDLESLMSAFQMKGFYQYKKLRTGCNETWNDDTAYSVKLSGLNDTLLLVKYSVVCTEGNTSTRPVSKYFKLQIGNGINLSNGGISSSVDVLNSSFDTGSSDGGSSSSLSSQTPMSSAYQGGNCVNYETYDPNKQYNEGELVKFNSNEVYSCLSLTECNEESKTPVNGNVWVNSWNLAGSCVTEVCPGVEEWDVNKPWTDYTVGDLVVEDNRIWKVIAVSWVANRPSGGGDASYSWQETTCPYTPPSSAVVLSSSSIALSSSSTPLVEKTLDFTAPAANTSYTKGDVVTFNWEESNTTENFAIYVSSDAVNYTEVVTGLSNNLGEYQHTLAQTGTLTFKIKLVGNESVNSSVSIEVSEVIINKLIEFNAPTDGVSTYTVGDPVAFSWLSVNVGENFKLSVSTDGGSTYTTVKTDISNSEITYAHTLTRSGTLKFKINLLGDEAVKDFVSITVADVVDNGCSEAITHSPAAFGHNTGDKVIFGGKLYSCVTSCHYTVSAYAAAWNNLNISCP